MDNKLKKYCCAAASTYVTRMKRWRDVLLSGEPLSAKTPSSGMIESIVLYPDGFGSKEGFARIKVKDEEVFEERYMIDDSPPFSAPIIGVYNMMETEQERQEAFRKLYEDE